MNNSSTNSPMNFMETAANEGSFSSFRRKLVASRLDETLLGKSASAILAPTDIAFDKTAAGKLARKFPPTQLFNRPDSSYVFSGFRGAAKRHSTLQVVTDRMETEPKRMALLADPRGSASLFDSNLWVDDDNSAHAGRIGLDCDSSISDRANEQEDANEVVSRHSGLVARIAHHLVTRLPASVDINDLMQSGTIGLIEASRGFDASQGASFETYASIRIRGAMLDELRKGDWVPRSVHRHLRAATKATRAVEQKIGRAATSREVAAAMDMPIDDFGRLLAYAVRGRVLSLDARTDSEDVAPLKLAHHAASPADHLDDDEFRRELVTAIESLPDRERLVLSLYYDQELSVREIGMVLQVSHSRVSQIHAQALVRVRAYIARMSAAASAKGVHVPMKRLRAKLKIDRQVQQQAIVSRSVSRYEDSYRD